MLELEVSIPSTANAYVPFETPDDPAEMVIELGESDNEKPFEELVLELELVLLPHPESASPRTTRIAKLEYRRVLRKCQPMNPAINTAMLSKPAANFD